MSQEYKMVPVTPTAEMLLAVGGRVTVDVWNAMLTAAPVPPADDTVVYRYQHEGAPGQWFYTRDPRYYNAEPVTLAQLLAALPKDGSLEAPAEDVRAMVDEPVRNQCDGCQAGIPIINGAHRMGKPGGYPDLMGCTAKVYRAQAAMFPAVLPHPPRHTGFLQPDREVPGYTVEQIKEYGAACVAAFAKQNGD